MGNVNKCPHCGSTKGFRLQYNTHIYGSEDRTYEGKVMDSDQDQTTDTCKWVECLDCHESFESELVKDVLFNQIMNKTITRDEAMDFIDKYNLVVRKFPTEVQESNLYPNCKEGDEFTLHKTQYEHSIILCGRKVPKPTIGGKWIAQPCNSTGSMVQFSTKEWGVFDTMEEAVLNAVTRIEDAAVERSMKLANGEIKVITKERAEYLHTQCRNEKNYIIDPDGKA